ncbi:MAG: hypothetical protein HPY66_2613 [Firmicutes bacterium]|nr:hypothetical protein [Bacillota bacterium]MDI6704999.1 DUF3343 domain-containing protein [Bacillota bacterium]
MPLTDFFVLAFDSTHHAIQAEKFLKEAGLKIEVLPTPRDITASCGLSIKFHMDHIEKVKEVIDVSQPTVKLYRGLRLERKTIYLEEEL